MDKELIKRYLEGNCSDEEKIKVTEWIEDSPDHKKEYDILRRISDILIWRDESIANIYRTNYKEAKTRYIRVLQEVLKIAAVVVSTIVIYKLIFIPDVSEDKAFEAETGIMQTLIVPSGQRAEFIMEDGTKVWLNAGSVFRFPGKFSYDIREVTLDGEAYFDVAKNQEVPFVVRTGRYDIKVIGTKFNLMAYNKSTIFETTLLDGSVEILNKDEKKGIILSPNKCASLKDDKIVITSVTDTTHLYWKKGIISFKDEPFSSILNKLELYFDVKITVRNDEILNEIYSGKFRTKDGIEHILKVFRLKTKFTYTIDDNIITIK
jgi:ferric-dicitrate binding protein FerR (iron transport regulator)